MMCTPHKKIYIVRHGERVDEVDPFEWERHCRATYNPIDMYHRVNDPPLTPEGYTQASEVARTLKSELQDANVQVIFSSKLTRAVQTAYHIALEMRLPIVLSRNFALTAAAVSREPDYSFLRMKELQALCPGVTLIDGDAVQSKFDTDEIMASFAPLPVTDTWHHAIEHVSSIQPVSIVVAHRESIRNMSQMFLKTPYCCYGVFHFPGDKPHAYQHAILHKLSRRCGSELEIVDLDKLRPPPKKVKKKHTQGQEQGTEGGRVLDGLFGATEVQEDEDKTALAEDTVHS